MTDRPTNKPNRKCRNLRVIRVKCKLVDSVVWT